jgi:hypothetical protein
MARLRPRLSPAVVAEAAVPVVAVALVVSVVPVIVVIFRFRQPSPPVG